MASAHGTLVYSTSAPRPVGNHWHIDWTDWSFSKILQNVKKTRINGICKRALTAIVTTRTIKIGVAEIYQKSIERREDDEIQTSFVSLWDIFGIFFQKNWFFNVPQFFHLCNLPLMQLKHFWCKK